MKNILKLLLLLMLGICIGWNTNNLLITNNTILLEVHKVLVTSLSFVSGIYIYYLNKDLK